MKYNHLVFSLFFFLFIFLTPAFATYSIETNVTYSGGYIPKAIACTNNTGTQYCYILSCNGNDPMIERYNATWGDRKYCNAGGVGAYSCSYWYGVAVANTTHLITVKNAGAGGPNNFRLVPIWNMTVSTTCTATDDKGPAFNTTGTSSIWSGGYYNIDNNNASSTIYWGLENGIRNGTTNFWLGNNFWDTDVENLRLPDQNDNTTIYGIDGNDIYTYVGGGYLEQLGNTLADFGVAVTNGAFDVWKINDSTTWLYAYDSTNLYRMNLTPAIEYTSTTITAIKPINNASVSNTPTLNCLLNPNTNGTLLFYYREGGAGSFTLISNQSITNTNSSNYYATPPIELGRGWYTWYCQYNDIYSYVWGTNDQYFQVETVLFWENPVGWAATIVGGFFDIQDYAVAKDIFSLFASIIIATISTVVISREASKKIHGNALLGIFFAVFVVALLIFAIAGFLNPWIVLAIFGIFAMIVFIVFKGGG